MEKMINDEKISKIFYSNCLFEALKAKIRDPKNVKILFVPKKLNGRNRIGFHCFWKKDNLVYDFKCESNVKYFWQLFLFKGYIRANDFVNYTRLIYWRLDDHLKKMSKDFGKKLGIEDPYSYRERPKEIPIESKWNKVREDKKLDKFFENSEVQVFYKDKSGKKHITYAVVHNGKVDIGKYKPLYIKWAEYADPYDGEDEEDETI